MADVDVNDILEFTVKGKFQGSDDVINVYQVQITDEQGGTKVEALVFAGEWVAGVSLPLLGIVSDQYLMVEIIVENLTQETFIGQIVVNEAGTNASDALSPQVCALVMARTPIPSIDGRKYLPPFGEDNIAAGQWVAATITALQDFAQVWSESKVATNLVTGTAKIVTKVAGVMTAFHNIEGTRVVTASRTQRRRTAGRGS